jgi:hypothetical protein
MRSPLRLPYHITHMRATDLGMNRGRWKRHAPQMKSCWICSGEKVLYLATSGCCSVLVWHNPVFAVA